MRILFLDDDQHRHTEFRRLAWAIDPAIVIVPVWTAMDAILALRAGPFDACSLDHDLQAAHYGATEPMPGMGRDVTAFLAQEPAFCPRHVNVHSMAEGRHFMAHQVANARHPNVDVTKYTFPDVGWIRIVERRT